MEVAGVLNMTKFDGQSLVVKSVTKLDKVTNRKGTSNQAMDFAIWAFQKWCLF